MGTAKPLALCSRYLTISWVESKSAITPSITGRTATMLSGVRPSMALASSPTANTCRLESARTATMQGSRSTIPCPSRYTTTLAVPRSNPMLRLINLTPKAITMFPSSSGPTAALQYGYAHQPEQLPGFGQRQAHHGVIIPPDAIHDAAAQALNAGGAGLGQGGAGPV